MGIRDWFKKTPKQATVEEVVGLQADIQQNYSRFVAQLQSFYNKTKEPAMNTKNQIIQFDKAQLREIDNLLINVFKLNSKKEVIRRVRYIELYFNIFWQKDRSYPYRIYLMPVDDEGKEKWSVGYTIQSRGKSEVYPNLFNGLNYPDLFQAISEIVYKYSQN